MKEYKVACTLDMEHRNGKKFHYETASVCCGGCPRSYITKDKQVAEKWLEDAKRDVPVFETRNHKEWEDPKNKNVIKYTQTNIRIVSRTVTDWK